MKNCTNNVFFLKNDEIQSALDHSGRQYFIGNLARPQQLNHLSLDDLEMGCSFYRHPKSDIPHYHSKSSEIIYVLQGLYRILIINTRKEYNVSKGDFIVLPPHTAYAGKAVSPCTKTLFVKSGGNDKVIVDIDSTLQKWLSDV